MWRLGHQPPSSCCHLPSHSDGSHADKFHRQFTTMPYLSTARKSLEVSIPARGWYCSELRSWESSAFGRNHSYIVSHFRPLKTASAPAATSKSKILPPQTLTLPPCHCRYHPSFFPSCYDLSAPTRLLFRLRRTYGTTSAEAGDINSSVSTFLYHSINMDPSPECLHKCIEFVGTHLKELHGNLLSACSWLLCHLLWDQYELLHPYNRYDLYSQHNPVPDRSKYPSCNMGKQEGVATTS